MPAWQRLTPHYHPLRAEGAINSALPSGIDIFSPQGRSWTTNCPPPHSLIGAKRDVGTACAHPERPHPPSHTGYRCRPRLPHAALRLPFSALVMYIIFPFCAGNGRRPCHSGVLLLDQRRRTLKKKARIQRDAICHNGQQGRRGRLTSYSPVISGFFQRENGQKWENGKKRGNGKMREKHPWSHIATHTRHQATPTDETQEGQISALSLHYNHTYQIEITLWPNITKRALTFFI